VCLLQQCKRERERERRKGKRDTIKEFDLNRLLISTVYVPFIFLLHLYNMSK
jgi:hypothetical protein